MKTTKLLLTSLFLILGSTSTFAEHHDHGKNHNHKGAAHDHKSHDHKSHDHKGQTKVTETKDITANSKGIIKEASIKGMVCAFCVDNIQKVFRKHKEVQDININLDTKLLTLVFKEGQNMDDQKITKLIKSSGYDVVSIKEKK